MPTNAPDRPINAPDRIQADRLCYSVAAALIGVSPRLLYTLAHKAGVPILLGGRRLIRRVDLATWIAGQPVDRIGDGQGAADTPAVEANGDGGVEGARA